jgi:hypothetical protein
MELTIGKVEVVYHTENKSVCQSELFFLQVYYYTPIIKNVPKYAIENFRVEQKDGL